jgi:hypothetical protein
MHSRLYGGNEMILENGIDELVQMEAFKQFKNSLCYNCGYCAESKMKKENFGQLDVRLNGAVKIWCYVAGNTGDVQLINYENKCFIKEKADNE